METVKCNYRFTDIFQFYPENKTLNRVKTVPRFNAADNFADGI